MDDMLIIPCGG